MSLTKSNSGIFILPHHRIAFEIRKKHLVLQHRSQKSSALFCPWIVENGFGIAEFENLAGGKKGHAICRYAAEAHLMSDEDEVRAFFAQLLDGVEHLDGQLRVHV